MRRQPQALAFVARRLQAESAGLVLAVRESSGERRFGELDELVVGGLEDGDARALLEAVMTGPLDERVRDRIVAETRGNPLALLELPRGRTPAQLAGGFGLDGGPALAGPHRGALSGAARDAAGGDPAAAARRGGRAGRRPAPALERGRRCWGSTPAPGRPPPTPDLIELGAQVRFHHPLVRSAVYGGGCAGGSPARPPGARRRHPTDPDRRAWHRAQATAGLDEDVAAELERSAARAGARGGVSAAAAFHERAAELTPDPARRARRALLAAQCKHQAGAPEAALSLLAVAQAGPLEELDSARAQLLRAQIIFSTTRGRDAPPLLLEAARRLEPLDATLARETYLDAFAAALSADRLVRGGDVREIAAAVLAAEWEPSARPCDLLLEGLARLATEGYAAGAPALKDALRAFREERFSEEEELRWLWLACHVARALGDDVAWDDLTARQVELARRTGALSVLPIALDDRIHAELFCGRLASAIALAAEADAVVEATGSHVALRGAIALANWRGQESEAQALVEARRQAAVQHGEGLWLVATDWGNAVRYNGLGRYDEALAAAERSAEDPRGLGTPMWLLADLVEAAARAGKPERAAGPLERLTEIAEANGTDWALGFLARSRALLERGRGGRAALPRGDRAPRPHPHPRRARPHAAGLRRVAAPREPPRRRSRAAPRRARDALRDRHGGLRRARPARAARHRGDGAQAHRRDDRRPHAAGAADRAARGGRADEPGDRRAAVPQPAHRRVAPAQGVRQARHQLSQGSSRSALPDGPAIALMA